MTLDLLKWPKLLSRSQEYLEIEKGDPDASENSYSDSLSSPDRTHQRRFFVSSILNIILAAAIFIQFTFGIRLPGQRLDGTELIKAANSFSPLHDKIPLRMTPKMINGSFMSETDPPDIFRALPSKEVDSAWHPIAKPTWITITESEARALGKDPSVLVKAPEEWGHGKDKYIAMMDINHQLHCVDLLRRLAFREDYPISETRIDFQREHWMHCVHILYQNAMCYGSTEIITYNWRETQKFPVPDFDVMKQCKNSELLLEFQEREKIVGMDALRDKMEKPADAIVLPLPPRLKAFLEAHDDE